MSTCSYILKKGKNKGQSCGIKCSNDKQLCKKHLVDVNEPVTESSYNSIIEENNTNSDILDKPNNSLDKLAENNQSFEEKLPKEKKVKVSKEKKEKLPKLPKEPKEKKEKEPKEKKEKEPKEKKVKEPKEISIKVQVYNKIKPVAKRNSQGNYVLENNLVVHPVNKKIIGRQKEEQVVNISIEDIEYCKENGFLYEQPSVLYFLNPEFEKRENELTKHLVKNNDNNDNNDNNEDDEIYGDNLDEKSDSEINSENDNE